MTDFGGDFVVPASGIVPGSITILGWSEAAVLVNKYPVTQLMEVEVTREMNTGSGQCTIKMADPQKMLYDLFQPQDEVEVFFSFTESGFTIGRKAWGGYVDHFNTAIDGGLTLTLSGKDYTSRLQSQIYSGSINSSLITALQTILATQSDFTYEGIPATLTDAVVATITNDNMYNGIQQICDQAGVYFWVDPETRDFTAAKTTSIATTTDQIVQGVNLLKQSQVTKNSEYLTNKLVVNYNGGTATTVQDTASQAANGVFSRMVTVGSLTGATQAQQYGQTTVTNSAAPADAFELTSTYLPYTDPGDYILCSVPALGIDGAHQITSLTHKWSINNGIQTVAKIGAQFIDKDLYIADLNRRLAIVERKTFTGT